MDKSLIWEVWCHNRVTGKRERIDKWYDPNGADLDCEALRGIDDECDFYVVPPACLIDEPKAVVESEEIEEYPSDVEPDKFTMIDTEDLPF